MSQELSPLSEVRMGRMALMAAGIQLSKGGREVSASEGEREERGSSRSDSGSGIGNAIPLQAPLSHARVWLSSVWEKIGAHG